MKNNLLFLYTKVSRRERNIKQIEFENVIVKEAVGLKWLNVDNELYT